MGRLVRGTVSGIALVILVFLVSPFADRLEDLGSDFIDRVGAAWGLAIVGIGTALLAFVWFRDGGTKALKRWGVILRPLPPESYGGSAPRQGGDPPLRRSERDPRERTPR